MDKHIVTRGWQETNSVFPLRAVVQGTLQNCQEWAWTVCTRDLGCIIFEGFRSVRPSLLQLTYPHLAYQHHSEMEISLGVPESCGFF